jgi:hypothetical protein
VALAGSEGLSRPPGVRPDSNGIIVLIGEFGSNVDLFAGALEKFPQTVDHSHEVRAEVVINDGGEAWNTVTKEFESLMVNYVTSAINDAFTSRLPDAPAPLRADKRTPCAPRRLVCVSGDGGYNGSTPPVTDAADRSRPVSAPPSDARPRDP